MLSLFKHIPILIVTATATPTVMNDIIEILNIEGVLDEYSLGTRRENLAINVYDNKKKWLSDIIHRDGTIVYTQTRKQCDKLFLELRSKNIPCLHYHAGLVPSDRENAHQQFLNGDIPVIIATISFGMGIDKSNIRHVVNYGVPTDIETYYQEIGRAGRDGLPCKSSIYYDQSDFGTASYLINQGATDQISRRTEGLNLFRQYLAETDICRQQMIDYYFINGKLPKNTHNLSINSKCGICDNCCGTTPGVLTNIEKDATMLSRVITQQGLGITRTLELGKKIGHKDYVRILLSSLIKHGVVESYFSTWGSSNRQQGTLYRATGNQSLPDNLTVRIPERFAHAISKRPTERTNKESEARTFLANKYNILEQTLMNDKILSNIIKSNPQTIEELWLVDGISIDFITKYGQEWIEIVLNSQRPPRGSGFSSTIEKTMRLVEEKKSIEEIANIRKLKIRTIEDHISEAWGTNPQKIDMKYISMTHETVVDILSAIKKTGNKDKLRPIMDNTNIDVSWPQLKLVVIASDFFSDEELINCIKYKSQCNP